MADEGGGTGSIGTRFTRLRRKIPLLDHLVRAKDGFNEHYGNHYAAAITYFSVLSLIPLLMVGFSVTGFVLEDNQAALDRLRENIITSAPDGLGEFFAAIVDAALNSRAGAGVLGILLALYSGLGWMTNLRDALTAQWGQGKQKGSFLATKLSDLLSLVGLGIALAVSFGVTAAGTGIGNTLLDLAGLQDVAWARFVLQIGAVVLALLANILVFLWVFSRLPRGKVSPRSALWGAITAAVGFEVLKQVGGIYLTRVLDSPSGALFGPIIGLLVFANLVSRFLLFVAAWMATTQDDRLPAAELAPPAVIRPTVKVRRGVGVRAAAGAFGVGAVVGWFSRRRSSPLD